MAGVVNLLRRQVLLSQIASERVKRQLRGSAASRLEKNAHAVPKAVAISETVLPRSDCGEFALPLRFTTLAELVTLQ